MPIRSGVLFCSSEAQKAYVNAEFHGRPLHCMLDTGCDRRVIGRRLLTNEELLPSRFALTAAGKNPLQVDGEAHIQSYIEGYPMEADVSVSSQLDELLLGCDWLTKQADSWNFKGGTLQLDDLEIRLRPKYTELGCRRVTASEPCVVPPHHEVNVPVRLEGDKVHQSSVDWALESWHMHDGILVARTLFGNEDNVKVARILNHTSHRKPF